MLDISFILKGPRQEDLELGVPEDLMTILQVTYSNPSVTHLLEVIGNSYGDDDLKEPNFEREEWTQTFHTSEELGSWEEGSVYLMDPPRGKKECRCFLQQHIQQSIS